MEFQQVCRVCYFSVICELLFPGRSSGQCAVVVVTYSDKSLRWDFLDFGPNFLDFQPWLETPELPYWVSQSEKVVLGY